MSSLSPAGQVTSPSALYLLDLHLLADISAQLQPAGVFGQPGRSLWPAGGGCVLGSEALPGGVRLPAGTWFLVPFALQALREMDSSPL